MKDDIVTDVSESRRPGDLGRVLTFFQERFWFLDHMRAAEPTFNQVRAVRLSGKLDAGALGGAVRTLVERHEMLRTTFCAVEGRVTPVVARDVDWDVFLVDLAGVTEGERSEQLATLLREERDASFDLEFGPLFYAKLYRLSEQAHLLLLNAHITVVDDDALDVALRELASIYNARVGASPAAGGGGEQATSFADYAKRQRHKFYKGVADSRVSEAKQALAGANFALDLPSDHPRPAVQTTASERIRFDVPKETVHALTAQTGNAGTELEDILLSGFVVLLHRYTGVDDLLIGYRTSHRSGDEPQRLIGPLTNTLVVRSRVGNDPVFADVLASVHKQREQAEAWCDVPFELLVEALAPERDVSRSPVVQVLFDYRDQATAAPEFSGLKSEWIDVGSAASIFDVALSLTRDGDRLHGSFTYSPALFEAGTIERAVHHLLTLFAGIGADPNSRFLDLPMLTDAERHRMVVEWNRTEMTYDKASCVHHAIERQARRVPDRVAFVFEDRLYTYGETNSRANKLAHHLRKAGVGTDDLVAVLLGRSPLTVIAKLAVFKAGAAYVPMDPEFPSDRLQYILADSGAKALLTTKREISKASPDVNTTVVCLDADWDAIAQEPDADVETDVGADHRAYVMYTSGSTGKPKGVQIEHRAVVNFLTTMAERPGMSEHDVVMAITTISFDISVLELWLPLSLGARIVLATRDDMRDGRRLIDLLKENNITLMQATPSTWRMMLELGWEGDPQLTCLCGGEAMPADLAQALVGKVGSLWNMYGPTETTVWSTCHHVTEVSRSTVPVGRPVGNTQIYILDPRQNPVPIGVAGNLFIGGDGVARGYLNRPELTAERFLPDPFCGKPDGRMYNTGDLARYLDDGTIDFIGRSDFQVKIRGFRIELGEIEAVLAQHPSVLQAVASVYQNDHHGPGYIAAYVTTAGTMPQGSELRAFVKARLPEYMVPAMYVALDAFPLTPNGKVDRKALPPPQGGNHDAGDAVFEAAATPVEQALVDIWRHALRLERISVHDNFFDLGGHSILAIRIFSDIDKQFGQALPLGALYEAPTIRQLAALLEDQERIWTPLVPIQDQGTKPPFFCVGGGILHMRNLSRRLGTDQPYYALQTETLEGERLLRADLEAIAEDMLREVRRIQPFGPYYLGGAYGSAMVALEMARRLNLAGEQVGIFVAFNTVPQLQNHSTVFRVGRRIGKLLRTSPARWAEQMREVSWLHARESLMSMYWQAAFRFYRAIGRPMPRRLRAGHYAEMLLRRAASSYRPEQTYLGDVTLFLTPDWYEKCRSHANWGWTALIRGQATADKVPGDPCTMFTEPNVSVLAQCLRARLNESRVRSAPTIREMETAKIPLPEAGVG